MIDDQGRSLIPPEETLSQKIDLPNKDNYQPKQTSVSRRGKSCLSRTYGLRPRTGLKRPLIDDDTPDIIIPIERKRIRGGGSGGSANGQSLSKYRRKTANARERLRMKEINNAFTTLRGVLPAVSHRRTAITNMTKITTLRLAVSYIQALSDILNEGNASSVNEPTSVPNSIAKQENTPNFPINQQQQFNYHQDSNISEVPPTTCNANIIPPQQNFQQRSNFPNCVTQSRINKHGWEEDHNSENDYMTLFGPNECNYEDNLPVWEDIPSLTDFCWSFS